MEHWSDGALLYFCVAQVPEVALANSLGFLLRFSLIGQARSSETTLLRYPITPSLHHSSVSLHLVRAKWNVNRGARFISGALPRRLPDIEPESKRVPASLFG